MDIKLKIKGILDKEWQEWLEGLKITHKDTYSLLTGTITDHASFFGLINKLRDLNLKIISIELDIENHPLNHS